MKIYVNETIGKVLNKKEYKELLERESKQYNKSVEELEEIDTDYETIEIDIKIGEKITLLDLDNYLQNIFEYDELDYITGDELLSNKSLSYRIIDGFDLNIEFDILTLNEENILDSELKINNVEII